jgi:type VI protein secretion system component VasK
MSQINVPISPGELIDKITILEIKIERMDDPKKVANVKTELDLLEKVWQQSGYSREKMVKGKRAELKSINEKLWVIEDALRLKESRSEFDKEFIELARSVYFTNDHRARVKKEINIGVGSDLVEEKSYQDYGHK